MNEDVKISYHFSKDTKLFHSLVEQSSIKQLSNKNEIIILKILQKANNPLTRQEIVTLTKTYSMPNGIARTTAYDSLQRLYIKGYVIKIRNTGKKAGRPKIYYQLKTGINNY